MKDLPDLALLAQVGRLDGAELRAAIDATFAFRHTHTLPPALPPPPASWSPTYERMAEQDDLPWRTLPNLLDAVSAFLDPVLRDERGSWNPDTWSW